MLKIILIILMVIFLLIDIVVNIAVIMAFPFIGYMIMKAKHMESYKPFIIILCLCAGILAFIFVDRTTATIFNLIGKIYLSIK